MRLLRPAAKSVSKGVVSAMQRPPKGVAWPEYAISGKPNPSPDYLYLYSDNEIPKVRKAARLARKMLEFANSLVQPGITTDEIDRITHNEIVKHGAYPTPLNYCGFPKSICTSVNEVVCHGIPDNRKIEEGDIVSIDVSLFLDGYHGDNCGSVIAGKGDEAAARLIESTKMAVQKAIDLCKPGMCITKIGETIELYAKSRGYDVVHEFCGHGTGKHIHMPPLILHYENDDFFKMYPGMVFTIEPILVEGARNIHKWTDNWTASTIDGGWSAQIEHEVLITQDGVEVLTLLE